MKRLTFTHQNNGTLKLSGTLVGFPDELSLGECTVEVFSGRNSEREQIIATFNTDQLQGLLIIRGINGSTKWTRISCTSYTRNGGEDRVHLMTVLTPANE